MILSSQLLLSDDQAITATALSTNQIDLGVAGTPFDAIAPLNRDIGKGYPVPVLIQVTEDFNNLTSLTVTIETDDDSAFGSPSVLITETIALADLVAGKYTNTIVLPTGIDERYLAVRYTVVGTAPSTGRITASITGGVQTNVTGP